MQFILQVDKESSVIFYVDKEIKQELGNELIHKVKDFNHMLKIKLSSLKKIFHCELQLLSLSHVFSKEPKVSRRLIDFAKNIIERGITKGEMSNSIIIKMKKVK